MPAQTIIATGIGAGLLISAAYMLSVSLARRDRRPELTALGDWPHLPVEMGGAADAEVAGGGRRSYAPAAGEIAPHKDAK